MERADIVILGGSAAGLAAAITARRHYPDKSMLLIRREEKVLVPCGIPYVYGTVGKPENNLIPDAILEKNGIPLKLAEVTGIDREKGAVSTGKGDVEYERLVIATGSLPVVPPIPGADRPGVFTVLKDIPHLYRVQEAVDKASSCAIVGGGFIGVEFADELKKGRDMEVSIIEMLPSCLMLAFEQSLTDKAEELLRTRGVHLQTSQKVESIEGNGSVTGVKLGSGEVLSADMVLLAIGCKANTKLAADAGLPMGERRGIQVDRHMRTPDERIFSCGDCAEKVSFFDGKPSDLKLASIACMEGRVAGANLYQLRRENHGTLGAFSTSIQGTAFATVGLSEAAARERGFDPVTGMAAAPNRHPGGMPGMAPLEVKLVFDKATGRVLGGMASGADSAGEIVNVISAAIHGRMTAEQLSMFQMATHPALTASPLVYQITAAAEIASQVLRTPASSATAQ